MNPVVGAVSFLVCLIAAFVWILLYFFLIEGLLKKIVGAIFGVTIGGSRIASYGYGSSRSFYISGWHVDTPGSGCLSGGFIWALGAVLRTLFIGVPVGGLLVL